MVRGTPGSAQDIFWVIQTLPGIASDGDNSKLYVRGGSPDENLVLYDGATIGNPFRGTPEKGRKLFERGGRHLADFVNEVKKIPVSVTKRDFPERAGW